MTNFIYIFMIITLICIGAGIKAFNSEDSDTKTTIKNIPNGIKKVLLIGTNVQKTDITILIGTIIYLMFTIGVICIYVFASHETKVELQYKLCVALTVYIFPATLFHEMDADGNIFRCRLDRLGRIKRVWQREVEREYEKAESLIKENNVVMAYGELFNMESEFWISILAEIEKPILCISAEADWNYNGEEIAQHVQNENVKFKILPDVDATMRLGFRNHLAANNLTYMGYLNRKGVTKPEDGKDIPCYAEDIGKCIMEYMEHLQ